MGYHEPRDQEVPQENVDLVIMEYINVAALIVAFCAVVVFPFVASLIWIGRDAEFRGMSGFLVAILAGFIAWPLSLLLWIALRPPPRILAKAAQDRFGD